MPRSLSDLKVLIIDDNVINHKILSYPLKSMFKGILSAYDGVEGLNRFKTDGADIILMDVSMPVMDGLTCTQAIRNYESENNALKKVIILAVTGSESDEDIESYLAAGMNGHVGKPVDIDLLLETIEDLL
ncbi:MAG: response regulator [Mangrovibacterium sp.]